VARLLLVLGLAATLAASAGATPKPVSEAAALGSVRATLTYEHDAQTDDLSRTFTNLRFTIERAGVVVLDRKPRPVCRACTTWPGSGGAPGVSSVHVADLDRNGEPVALLDLYTGGAHCCLYTVFFRFDGTAYRSTRHDWGNPGYRFVDLGHDGVFEFLTRDDRFNYTFSCYACSATPVRVLRVAGRRLVDVTRRFPSLIRRDAASIWRAYRTTARHHQDVAGLLPAYVADETLVGRARSAWARLRRAVSQPDWPRTLTDPRWKQRGRYLDAVRRFLRRTGYVR
jgi:hypothetical protein